MGVYPCKHCGALFISVNMRSEPHRPGCPFSAVSCEPCIVCGKVRATDFSSASCYCGCVDHLNGVRRRKGMPPIETDTISDDTPSAADMQAHGGGLGGGD
jgi:hypothetical protein